MGFEAALLEGGSQHKGGKEELNDCTKRGREEGQKMLPYDASFCPIEVFKQESFCNI